MAVTEDELFDSALHGLKSAKRLTELAGTLEEQGKTQEATAHYLEAYGLVSGAHLLLDMGVGGDAAEQAFDEADELRTQIHEELLERLGVPFVSAEEIAKAQQRRRQRWRMKVIPGSKEPNARKRRLLR